MRPFWVTPRNLDPRLIRSLLADIAHRALRYATGPWGFPFPHGNRLFVADRPFAANVWEGVSVSWELGGRKQCPMKRKRVFYGGLAGSRKLYFVNCKVIGHSLPIDAKEAYFWGFVAIGTRIMGVPMAGNSVPNKQLH